MNETERLTPEEVKEIQVELARIKREAKPCTEDGMKVDYSIKPGVSYHSGKGKGK